MHIKTIFPLLLTLCSMALPVVVSGTTLLAADESPAVPPKLNPKLLNLKPNEWWKLHEQRVDDKVRFRRQGHGGSCFDHRRGRLILFGSDTHGRDWTNSPLIFDPVAANWTRLYPDDDRSSYAVDRDGVPVAGKDHDHPWAMHTFGAVLYDPRRDEMIVASFPGHMVPGRFTDSVKDLWPRITRFPTWTFDLKGERWRPLPCDPIHFFPYCAAVDTDRNVVLGYRPDGIYELSGEPRNWNRLTRKVFLGGWHNNCAYDSKHKALIVFGTNADSNDIEVFFPKSGKHGLMLTPGRRPPKDQHNPMAFDPEVGRTVVVVDHKLDRGARTVAETWLYDLESDSWSQITTATLPFGCGMNYDMEYDPNHNCLLLVAGGYGQQTTVWALKIRGVE